MIFKMVINLYRKRINQRFESHGGKSVLSLGKDKNLAASANGHNKTPTLPDRQKNTVIDSKFLN